MPRSMLFALISVGLLSACVPPPPAPMHGGLHSESVGFSGVGEYNF